MGLAEGFQWVDGSFTENIELIERRTPNDVDVVTFSLFKMVMTMRWYLREIPHYLISHTLKRTI
ncbi:DUF6932 family protein [Hafnia paralvei]|uniref:DUF6932 family protein n=1 Tax=Hafnia paralvei TaxID=546367 RepID=UPI0039C87A3D